VVDHAPAEWRRTDADGRLDRRPRPAGDFTAQDVAATLQRAADDVARLEKDLLAADQQVTNLRTALQSNRRIGMAIGILMALRRIDEETAFDLLKEASSRGNVKLRLVAEEVIRTGSLD
jgi:AmiR/NasT family two-component response regulator